MRRVGPLGRALLLIAALSGIAQAQDAKPAPLARYFPKKDLIAYVEFDGIGAHSEAWKKTAASRILNETPAGTMLTNVATQILEAVLMPGEEGMPTPDEVTAIVRESVQSGFAFAINRKPDDASAKPSCVGLVLRGAGRGPLVATIKKVLKASGVPDEGLTTLDKPGGRKVSLLGPAEGPCVAWWVEKDDLVFSILEARYVDVMIATLDGKEPNAVEHPSRQELLKVENGFEPTGLAFLDATALPEMPPEAAMFGLDGIKKVDIRWGYQGEALVSVSRILAPSPRKGVLAMYDQPTFDGKSLPPLPDGVGDFTVLSIDLVKVYDQFAALAKAADPKGADLFAEAAEEFQKETGRRLREDFLGRVGPKMVFADVPTQIFLTSNPADGFAQTLARVPRFSILIELRDRANFLKDLEAVAKWANAQFPIPKDPKAKADKPAPMLIRRLKNVEDGYEVALSPTYWPLPAGYRPSIIVGEKYVAIGTSPDVVKQALRKDGELGAPLARAIATLPTDLTVLSVVDTKNSPLPEVLANVPSLIQWWGFMIQGSQAVPVLGLAGQVIDQVVMNEVIDFDVMAVNGQQVVFAPPALFAPPAPPAVLPPGAAAPVPPPMLPPGALVLQPGAVQFEFPGGEIVPDLDLTLSGLIGNQMIKPLLAPSTIKFRLRLDPDEIPSPSEIRPFLFPATYSLSADASGFRITTREAFPSWNPISLAPMAVAMALPGFQDWREARERERASANLKQIGVALNQYHATKKHYPPASTSDKDGKPLLSWRVELLPSLGLQSLYDEFHRDEPWDSPHNKRLLEKMPPVFAHPEAQAGPGLTFYRGLSGKGAFFDPEVKDGITFDSITDGQSTTLAIVEAKEAVPWTKPGTEIAFDQPNALALLGGNKPDGFQALFPDGSVRFMPISMGPVLFGNMATRAGGEPVGLVSPDLDLR